MPADFTVLLENITDFDHGVFAHQSIGFDLYSGSREHPQRVQVLEEVQSVSPFTIAMRTAAVAGKLTGGILPQSKKGKPGVAPDEASRKIRRPVTFPAKGMPRDAVAAAEAAFVAALRIEHNVQMVSEGIESVAYTFILLLRLISPPMSNLLRPPICPFARFA